MTTTTAELRNKVAINLRIKGADVELDAERAAILDDIIGEVSADYREKGLIWWADNAIPNACVNAMKLIVSGHACAAFGKAKQGYEDAVAAGKISLAELKPSAVIGTVCAEFY